MHVPNRVQAVLQVRRAQEIVLSVCLLLNVNGLSARAFCECVVELVDDKGKRSGAFMHSDALESLGLECGKGGLVDGLEPFRLSLFLGLEPLPLGLEPRRDFDRGSVGCQSVRTCTASCAE
jgi:hypothetical protein